MKEYVILAVSNDKFELPEAIYLNYKEMAKRLKLSLKNCHSIVSKGGVYKKTNCKFIKVNFGKE